MRSKTTSGYPAYGLDVSPRKEDVKEIGLHEHSQMNGVSTFDLRAEADAWQTSSVTKHGVLLPEAGET